MFHYFFFSFEYGAATRVAQRLFDLLRVCRDRSSARALIEACLSGRLPFASGTMVEGSSLGTASGSVYIHQEEIPPSKRALNMRECIAIDFDGVFRTFAACNHSGLMEKVTYVSIQSLTY
jgi:hypothetical protein